MELWSKWMEYCQLVALVGLPVLERRLDGDQLRGRQGVQILAFQMPASSQGTSYYPNHNMNIQTSSELIKGPCRWKLEANLWNRNTDLSSICMLSFSYLTLSISALRLWNISKVQYSDHQSALVMKQMVKEKGETEEHAPCASHPTISSRSWSGTSPRSWIAYHKTKVCVLAISSPSIQVKK